MPFSGVQTCADRKSTRLNSSHTIISYAVFCLKKKKQYRPPLGRRHGVVALTRRWRTRRPAPSSLHARLGSQTTLAAVSGALFFFFFNDTATTEIYTLSLHDALPI